MAALPIHVFSDRRLQVEFQCRICTNCISQCYSTKCGHLFCSKCIVRLLSPHSSSDSSTDDDYSRPRRRSSGFASCPVCNQFLQTGDIFPAPYVDQKMQSQVIRCLHYDKGCLWTGTLAQLRHKEGGHLKQCGYTLYTCKSCKQKIIRHHKVKHQNEECKSQYMLCPYVIYGCSFECRIREMEEHCRVNELKHVKLKLDYLEQQMSVPEILKLSGMTGQNNQYVEANGKFYLAKQQAKQKKKKKRNLNGLQPITYKKNGGYSLEFNQNECIWHLRSLYYGLVAYGMPVQQHQASHDVSKYLNGNCVWKVYYKHGDKRSLTEDRRVKVESIPMSDGMMKLCLHSDMETDTEEIVGELGVGSVPQYPMVADQEQEGVVQHRPHHEKRLSWWDSLPFGRNSELAERQKGNVTARRLEFAGVAVLTGIVVYYAWSRFAKAHARPLVDVLRRQTAILIPKH